MSEKIAIIGAGISGLVSAINLEKRGYAPIIFEADDKIGGRVQSDIFEKYILDRGFQVLLSAYPLAKKYLDYDSLELQTFKSGSYIFKNNRRECIGDPSRDKSLLFSTLFTNIGSFSDKLKIFKLSKQLKKKSIETIFKEEEIYTIDYLKRVGFSKSIINDFFKPFFTGIFLESELHTSSRMFEFIFKMFSEGEAVIPRNGIQEIPNQLASNLKKTDIKLNTKVTEVSNNKLVLEGHTEFEFDYCIVATEASQLVTNLSGTEINWKSTQTLYFEVSKEVIFNENMIGLLANEPEAYINSISFPKTIEAEEDQQLLSVSIVKPHSFTEYELIERVKKELKQYFKIAPLRHLKTYDIKKSLPDLKDVRYSVNPSELQLTESIFLTGDTILNGSLNAAMLSGELAAEVIHEKITGNILK